MDHVRVEGSDGQAAEEYRGPRMSGAWLRVVPLAPVREEWHGREAFGQERNPFVVQRLHAVMLEFGLLIYVYDAQLHGG